VRVRHIPPGRACACPCMYKMAAGGGEFPLSSDENEDVVVVVVAALTGSGCKLRSLHYLTR